MKVLFVFAHPDDVEIYCGGLLNKLYDKNVEIKVCCVANRQTDKRYEEIRRNEMCNSMETLGVETDFIDICDGKVGYRNEDFNKLCSYIYTIDPNLIITHNNKDYHADHRSVSNMVYDSASYKYPVLMSDTLCGNSHEPEYFCDITNYMKKKIELISNYESQLKLCNYIQIVAVLNSFRFLQYTGKTEGYCEGYSAFSKYHYKELENILNILF